MSTHNMWLLPLALALPEKRLLCAHVPASSINCKRVVHQTAEGDTQAPCGVQICRRSLVEDMGSEAVKGRALTLELKETDVITETLAVEDQLMSMH